MKAPGPSRAGAFTPLMLPVPRMQGAGQGRAEQSRAGPHSGTAMV